MFNDLTPNPFNSPNKYTSKEKLVLSLVWHVDNNFLVPLTLSLTGF